MLNYRKISKLDYGFIDELLNMSSDNHEFGIAYPRGDLVDIRSELLSYDQKLDESFYIIEKEKNKIGIIGIIYDDETIILVGPIFLRKYHVTSTIYECLCLFLNKKNYKDREIIVYVVRENKELTHALLLMKATEKTKHISMNYNVDEYSFGNSIDNESIVELEKEEIQTLEKLRCLFEKNMPYPIDDTINKFLDCLNEGYTIAVLFRDNHIIGFIIWMWSNELHFGRLDYLCIDKKYQRLGFGRKLMSYAVEKIHKRINGLINPKEEFNLLHVDLSQSNSSAFKCYTDFGFKVDYYYTEYQLPIHLI